MASNGRVQKMEQQFIELRRAIASDLDERFKTLEANLEAKLETTLEAKLEAKFDEKFAEQERRLTDRLTGVIVRQLETAERHLEDRLKIHVEELKSLVVTAAEGYGGTLDKIEREMVEMNKKFDTKLLDHDKVLADHNQRLLVVERRRRARRAKPRG